MASAALNPELFVQLLKDDPHELRKRLATNELSHDFRDADGWTVLMHASEKGWMDVVHAALGAGAGVNAVDPEGWTALMLACVNEQADIAALLLQQPDIDVNARNQWKSTALILTAFKGHIEIVRLLLEAPHIEVNAAAEYYGRTALIEAAKNGQVDIVDLLLEKGADVNAVDKSGKNTALIEAIKNGQETVAKRLIDHPDIDFLNAERRRIAFLWAASTSRMEIIDLMDARAKKQFAALLETP